MTGRVYLVGAGPGDAGLLTTHGRRLLAAADAVVYDRLISPRLLDFVPRRAERLYVGKSPGRHALSQEAIQEALVDLAQRCNTVVRLKGGDPFVFGRGSEEAEWLRRHGVAYEVVPGVTSAVSVPAYAGIPLTARGVSAGFAVVTGQSGDQQTPDVTTSVNLVRQGGTLVVLMGMGRLCEIATTLTVSGVSADIPAAAIEWGTRAKQRSVHATLGTLAREVESAGLGSPAVIVIGETARLHADVAWVTARPLFGKRVVLAVETEQEAQRAGDLLESLGAEFVTFVAEREAVVNEAVIASELSRFASTAPSASTPGGAPVRRLSFRTALDASLFFRLWTASRADLRHLAGVTLAATESAAKVLAAYGLNADEMLPEVSAPRYAAEFTLPLHVAEEICGTAVDEVWTTSEIAWVSLMRAANAQPSDLPPRRDLREALARLDVASRVGLSADAGGDAVAERSEEAATAVGGRV